MKHCKQIQIEKMELIPIEKNIRKTHFKSKFLVINVNDYRWNDIVFKSLQYDFYHTQSYHLLEKEKIGREHV